MRGKLSGSGRYELFLTTNNHLILSLNDDEWYAIVNGAQGELMVHSDGDHQRKKTVHRGSFYFADFNNDPEFSDMPHLFLKEGSKFREWILPNGTPTKRDHQKKLIRTDNLVSAKVVEDHVKGSGDTGTEKQYVTKAEGLRSKTKKELYDIARSRGIEGRSQLSKEELVQVLKN